VAKKSNKKNRKRSSKKRYNYTQGGRVALQRGGPNERVDQVRQDGPSGEMPIPTQRKPQPAPQPVAQTQAQQPIEQAPVVEEQVQQPVPTPAPTPTATPAATVTTPTTKVEPPVMEVGKGLRGALSAQAKNVKAVADYYKAQPDNPLAAQSDLGQRIAGGEYINSNTFYWIQPDGTIGKTNEGWSKVPKQFQNQVYLNEVDAIDKVQEYLEWDKSMSEDKVEHGTDIGLPVELPDFQEEREQRVLETGRQAEQMAQGVLPEGIPSIPDPEKISREGTEITPEQAAELQMKTTKEAQAATVGAVSPEQVTTIDEVAKAAEPKPFEAATIAAEDVAKVPEEVVVEAATGNVSPEVSDVLSKAAGVDRVAPIEAAEVEVVSGALQERVIGTISPEAKANAAKVAGTSLAKVTRAKKQLRNAGLSEEDIQELGNDPEALEVRLTDFTEEQRGIVEGLPEEALVSNQIDSLLEGVENGNIPPWASPAVAAVEQMLAQRGMSASTVGRDSLLNAIITSALPIAQANAQAIQQSVTQQKSIEATAALKDAEMAQQTALFNAQNVFQMDMAQFSADQQRAVNNAKFLQTVSLTNANMEQQAVVQDAVLLSQANLAEADQNTKLGIQHAQAFLAMDMANLNNQQQANVLKAQQLQQRLLSNQSAANAALQFNATSEQQTNQFMASLKAQTDQFNATQTNAMAQFNAQQENAAEARRVANEFEAAKLDAQMATEIDKFNSAQAFAREQFNVQNATAIAQSNVQWRRQANTADTAAINAVNQQNAQNAFGLTSAAQNFLWQELRDEADYIFKRWDNEESRKASLMIAALGNEGATSKESAWGTNLAAITKLVEGWLD
jgi:hypothetical protein